MNKYMQSYRYILFICFFTAGLFSQQEKFNIYAGVERCQVCHETPEMGNQHGVWKDTKHAKAYETLLTEESALIVQEKGYSTPAYETPECLSCHVTGYNNPDAIFAENFTIQNGVQCESCHGAGESYRKEIIMCDREVSIVNGLILPKPDDCLTCHNEKSPRYKPFDYEVYYKKMEHHKNPEYKCETEEDEDEDW
ncbi:MAG: cytochrome C554 [Bacteroidetes bacterium]|nr:cytochrome C554 [Bacteroidota bacterium]